MFLALIAFAVANVTATTAAKVREDEAEKNERRAFAAALKEATVLLQGEKVSPWAERGYEDNGARSVVLHGVEFFFTPAEVSWLETATSGGTDFSAPEVAHLLGKGLLRAHAKPQ